MTSPTRRDLLRVAGLGVVGTAAASTATAVLEPVAGHAATTTANAGPGADFVPDDLDLHLLRRTTYGATPSLLAAVHRSGRRAWLDQQLNPSRIDDSACTKLISSRFPTLGWSIAKVRSQYPDGTWDVMMDLGAGTLSRAVWSKRQLLEVMVDFWSNHLNVTNPSDFGWDCRADYDRTVIRKHALGRFEDMLIASAQHPAMLHYLNNDENTRYAVNENYGRELLELHTVSVEAGYSETDMLNSAKIMTGFGVDWETGLYRYSTDDHYTGNVKVMGFSSANASRANGHALGIDYLKFLARHPQTAQHLARKLVTRFVSDVPNADLTDALAHTYLKHGTDIRPVLEQLLTSKAFNASVGKKVRRPTEDVIATLRILGYKPETSGKEGMQALYWMVQEMGHAPFAWSQPDGYPDVAASWQSAGTTLARWNSHMSLAAHWWPSQLIRPDLLTLLPKPLPPTHGHLVDALARRLVFRTLHSTHKSAVLTFLGKNTATPLQPDDEAVTWRLPYLVALILDSPYHAVR
jgi:hypothetical protein